MFIEKALIAGDVDQRWRRRQRFISRNRARLEEWEQLGERSRRGSPGGVAICVVCITMCFPRTSHRRGILIDGGATSGRQHRTC